MRQLAYTVFHPITEFGVFLSFRDRVERLAYARAQDAVLAAPASPMGEEAVQRLLAEIFTRHNDGSQPGRSVSVGDVVTVDGCGTYAVESCGWRALEGAESARFARQGGSIRAPIGSVAVPATH